ncbi:anaphase-promoting complex subunit 10-like [Amblyomma americanum]
MTSLTDLRISVRVGCVLLNLREIALVNLNKSWGWVHISTWDPAGRPVRTMSVEITALSNHKNAQDTCAGEVKLCSPVSQGDVCVLLHVHFTSRELRMHSVMR